MPGSAALFERIEVTSDADVMGGSPCVAGTRVRAETVIVNLRAGYSLERIQAAYPSLPPGGVEAAIRWAEANGIDWHH